MQIVLVGSREVSLRAVNGFSADIVFRTVRHPKQDTLYGFIFIEGNTDNVLKTLGKVLYGFFEFVTGRIFHPIYPIKSERKYTVTVKRTCKQVPTIIVFFQKIR